jgi:hypothetical protein
MIDMYTEAGRSRSIEIAGSVEKKVYRRGLLRMRRAWLMTETQWKSLAKGLKMWEQEGWGSSSCLVEDYGFGFHLQPMDRAAWTVIKARDYVVARRVGDTDVVHRWQQWGPEL